ncbi:D-amino acid dehydrogenase small subunit [Variovorax sp. PBS-H4]|uniref:D-amino acid dehydrogenase n=1 Tax=Variovorax sp. PBS-H4 TaxID=434008 RepID=UPI001317EFD0|nr:D-amino acid dehydrogenase [Variovorax sp. PBS-H4]VTU39550.1 D-amino acid dehydrogenase small subunit [Variovorax sp. PBS-H4]
MHVGVLGAGIVGLSTAWQLSRRGFQVSVVDRAAPGSGASGGNGAQLSYSYVQPLADPSIWKQLPKLLFSPSSPLKLRPQLDPLQWRWGLAFLAACNARTSHQTTARLLALAAESRVAFEAMLSELRPDCDFSSTGKLVLYASAASLDGARRQLELQRTMGSEQRLLTPDESIAIEPALAAYRGQMAGAIHTPSECAADCLKLCIALEHALRARGVRFLLDCEVQGFDRRDGRVAAVRTSAGDVEADAFVMALGTASHRLGRQLGAYLPVYPLKGYSITVDVDGAPGTAPHVSVTDSARKVVFARIGSRLRVAGMAELVGHDASIPATRIETLAAATRAVFPQAGRMEALHPWTGMRPATPTGVPIIGHVAGAPSNVVFNTGHGALGFTLAFGSAERVARQLAA